MTCVHKVRWSVKRPEDCRFRLSVSHYKDRIVAPDEYSGATVVTPSDSEQVLETKDKLVRDDITIFPAPTETLSTTSNGTFTPSDGKVGFSQVDVNVNPDLRPLAVSENGQYSPDDFDGYSDVIVDVVPDLRTLTASSNGLYQPDGFDGYNSVEVSVPQPSGGIEITQNGTYDVEQYASAVVNVASTIGIFIKSVTIEAPAGRASVSYSAKDMLTLFELSDAGIYLILAENNNDANGVDAVFLFKMSADATTTDNGFKFMTISKDWTTSNASRAAQVLCTNGAILKLYQLPVPIVQ